MLNVIALCLICPLSYNILRTIRSRTMPRQDATKNANATTERTSANDPTKTLDANTALNITLFPPLFFFSALFYTDIMSTLVVLLSYSALLNKRSISGSLFENANIVIIGIVSLLFRQTNIFWVAIFPAGLTVIDALKAAALPSKSPNAMNLGEILQDTWDKGTIHDCSVQEAGLQGTTAICMNTISLVLTIVRLHFVTPYSRNRSSEEPIRSPASRLPLSHPSWTFRQFRGLEW
jgi:alpha-1,2-glucosyltransferase